MDFLKWYAPIIVSVSLGLLLIDAIQGIDMEDSLLSIMLYAPIVWYLWKIKPIIDKESNKKPVEELKSDK